MEDLELVDALRHKREEAVPVFLQRFKPLFLHCIGNLEAEPATRDDLYQDAVMYVLERLDQGSFDATRGTLATWVYRVAWCRCVDLKRKESGRRTPKLMPLGDKVPERADSSPGPSEEASTSEVSLMVQKGMATLEAEERALLEMRFVEVRTIQEIATVLGISVEQTKYRLKGAATSLRRVLLNDFAMEEAAR